MTPQPIVAVTDVRAWLGNHNKTLDEDLALINNRDARRISGRN